jgi:hypothetical protein
VPCHARPNGVHKGAKTMLKRILFAANVALASLFALLAGDWYLRLPTITVNLRSFSVFVDRQQIWQGKKKIGMFLKKIIMFSAKDHDLFGKRS